MNRPAIETLLRNVAAGRVSAEAAAEAIARLPFEDLGFARVDHHRALRCGVPEVIFGAGKTPEHVETIFTRLARYPHGVLATRVEPKAAQRLRRRFPHGRHNPLARTFSLIPPDAEHEPAAAVSVVAAGTSDLPVAEEARETLAALGISSRVCYDVGVAGLHRLLAVLDELRSADVLIVIAGMEGALPSVVGGLVSAPIIAVPTSVGYGASLGGLAALLAMLNSCASGVSVVNIDNGFGAAYQAAMIARRIAAGVRRPEPPTPSRSAPAQRPRAKRSAPRSVPPAQTASRVTNRAPRPVSRARPPRLDKRGSA
ncbi:MAG: nickel pincer cofactor biosynthesis protein LarB [Planctomycetia bacterium]|nr:MAG: nickel pincer cofactor biosynthesis protein LarB [Planctomycetia bacterium]